jgi:hypothetical protein
MTGETKSGAQRARSYGLGASGLQGPGSAPYTTRLLKRNSFRKEILKLENEVVNSPVLSVVHSPGIVNNVKFQYNFKGSESIILLSIRQLELILISKEQFCRNMCTAMYVNVLSRMHGIF